MPFNEAAVDDLFSRVVSHAMETGYFSGGVFSHEPKVPVGNGLAAAVWVDRITPFPRMSGLNITAGVVILTIRIYSQEFQEPQDQIDPTILKATMSLMNTYTGDFDLGQTVTGIDLQGAGGSMVDMRTGRFQLNQVLYRAMDIALPVIIADLWPQAG